MFSLIFKFNIYLPSLDKNTAGTCLKILQGSRPDFLFFHEENKGREAFSFTSDWPVIKQVKACPVST